MLVKYMSPSGVVVFALLYCCIASWTSVVVSVSVVVCSSCVFPLYVPAVLCALCLTVLVNCLLNVFAICVGEVIVFYLKVIVSFLGRAVFCWLICVWASKEYVCCV